jgi:hypothetical protein
VGCLGVIAISSLLASLGVDKKTPAPATA